MTQHTQPVVAAQHQNQQQQHQQQTSTAQQQNTTTPNSNNNNNNNAINNNNNNNTNSTPTTTNNNQTQTVAVQQQQHQNNNNNNNSYQNATGGQMFNPQLQSANVYVPAHPHHHPQPHHHQAGAMYQTMIPAAIPSNVFVNNVTANVNLHGWPHTVPHGTWVPAGSAPQYLHGELPPEQGAPVIQPLGAMPLTIPAPNALAGPVVNPNPTVITGGTRGSRKGQGRGGSSGSRRGDYNMQRHPPPEGSPAPQQAGQNNQQDIQQPGQQPADAQQMMTTLQPSYVQHPQYPYPYGYGYPTYFASQQHMIHPGQSAAAQHATGTPLYFQPMPVYNGPHMYNYGYYVSQLINQTDYPYGEEVGVGDDRAAAAGDGGMMWPQQHIYADEYAMGAGPDMHAVPSDDINHNASSIGSANETPNLLSPNYTPMYEQMTQQMGVMQIYDDPQMGQMHVMHRQGAVQMDDEISECGSQPSMQIVAPQPIQIVPAAAVSPMSLTANSNEQILQQQQQQTPHLIPVSGDNIMPTDSSLTNNNTTTPQQQIQQQQQSIIGDHTDDGTSQRYDHVAHNAKKLDANFNEETVQSTDDNLTKQEYEQLLPTEQMLQQQQIEMQEIEKQKSYDYNNQNIIQDLIESNSKQFGETVQSGDDNLKKKELEPQLPTEQMLQQQQIEMQEMEEQKSYNNSYNKIMQDLKDLNSKRYKNTTDVAIETVATNVVTNRQQQQSQQQTQDRPHKQQPQQYVSKQNVPQETQQYQHQQLQTQPITPVAQQQPIHHQKSNQQQQQPQHHHHHQTSNQQQQQQHHNSQQQQQQPQQSYENRKSSQMYNQQHQLRNRKYDYHYNDGSSHHQQQQSQQQTKTMSWTNSSQHKKSTNTVGVTATPTSSHSSSIHNKSSNATNTSSTHTHGSRSYYQHHTNYQQQNYHYQQQQQQQQHQPTTRNHAAMKMPSSPISSGPNTMERKTSQSSDAGKQTQQQTTSTASITAAPHQFQQQQPQQSQQTSTNDMVSTQQTSASTAVSSGTTTSSISSKQSQQHQQQQSQHNPPGFATKKHSLSNQGHSSSSFGTNSSTASTATSNAVETSNTPAINLAPPVTAQTTSVAPSTPSWASLFASNTNASSSNSSNTSASANNSLAAASNSSSTSSGFTKKPIAKVAPYEGITPVTPPPPVVTPGTLSYSAASAQNLPPSTNNSTTAAKKSSTSLSSEQQSQRNSLANLDEYSLKFAEFLTKYKSDWAPISLRPRGLTNRSNYCYINSILQALLGCSPLYNLIRSIPKQAANLCEVKTPTVNAMMTFMSNFSNLPTGLRLRTTKGGKGNKDDLGGDLQCDPAFEPTEIYKLWNDSREEHVEGRQEDAEEFLSYILNKLNDEMLEVIKLIAKPNPEQNGQNEPPEEDGDVWQVISNNRNKGSVTRQTDFGCTPLSDIFRGELRSRLQREGEHSTDVIQPFFTLQLNIEKAASVKEALEILVGRDQLEGVTGSKSKQEVVAWQQMNLEKLPPILILHLKWFDYRSDGCTKILKKVEFPVELKIDTKILASKNYSQKKRAYRLFAVVYHDGKEATKGHYITDVYHTGYGSWLRYDDSSVKPVSENHVLLPRTPRVPYLLCYRRCDTIPQQSNNNQNNNNSSGNTQSSTGK